MKKISTRAVAVTKNFRSDKLTIGLDLGDRNSWYCMLDEAGQVLLEQKLSTTAKAGGPAFRVLCEGWGFWPTRRTVGIIERRPKLRM